MFTGLSGLVHRRNAKSARASSWDRTGKNKDSIPIPAGQTAVIADIQGAGCVKHIWMTIASQEEYYPRRVLLRAYWDGEEQPSIESPIGDFFGVGHGVTNHFMSLPLNMVTRQDRPQRHAAMNCFFPMPFAQGARFEIVNEGEQDIAAFYYYIDYESYPNEREVPELRFHAHWRREFTTPECALTDAHDTANLTGYGNYIILDAEGAGHYVGCNLSIDHINPIPNFPWFGEGDDMIFIDGEEWPPTLHGTGTEDYFCAAWGYPSLEYSGPYHGISLAAPIATNPDWPMPRDKDLWPEPNAAEPDLTYSGKWTMYRFHIEDPVYFHKSIKVTIEHGTANCHADDYSSAAYWYQTEPHKEFPAMLPVEKRLPLTKRESLRRFMRTI